MLDTECGCQGGLGLSGGVRTRGIHSLQPCSGCSPATGAAKPPEHQGCRRIFSPPNVSKQHFSSALFSEMFELFLLKLPSKFQPEADAQCGKHQSEKPCAAERQRRGMMGLWLDQRQRWAATVFTECSGSL